MTVVHARFGCLLIAVILFVLAAFGVSLPLVHITELGLAVFAAAFMFPVP